VITKPGKMTKGVKKGKKGPKKSINRSDNSFLPLQFENQPKGEKTPLLKE
jgi:hypothetical protein